MMQGACRDGERRATQQAKPATELTGGAACMPGGFPGMMGPVFPLEVLQSPGQVTIIAEAFAQVRRIYLNEKQIAVEDAEPLFWGHSVGHWEGNTLIVNTIGLKETVRVSGVPHSPNMRIDERITVTSADTFEDRITVTDPEYLTAPWTWTYKYNRRKDYKINEYVCEDNRLYLDPATGQQKLRLGDSGRNLHRLDVSLRRLATVLRSRERRPASGRDPPARALRAPAGRRTKRGWRPCAPSCRFSIPGARR